MHRIPDNPIYEFSPIVERPQLRWPGNAKVAFYIGLNLEHFLFDRPGATIVSATAGFVPDPLNHGWRDYSLRVGFWRLLGLLDELKIRASVLLNADVCRYYPQVVAAGCERSWCWLAHGSNNSTLHTGLNEEEERSALTGMVSEIKAATGAAPRGWLGPGMTETSATPKLLAELGFSYVLDWCNDDQPYRLSVPGMISVPYSAEINDLILFGGRNLSGPEFERILTDQLEQLLIDSAASGRVMALGLHPFVIGQPFRHKYLANALTRIAETSDVWLTTSDEIASYYLAG